MAAVYCIIVTYNGMQWIARCLDSLKKSTLQADIFVIDNASTDTTVEYISHHYPNVKLISSEKNLGFGQGNNIGLKLALKDSAEHIFLLNQDATVEPDTLQKLVDAQKLNPEFGIISPAHLNGDGTRLDHHFLKYFLKSEISEYMESALLKRHTEAFLIDTSFVNAAAWLISNDCLKITGGFDPIFFHYGEDDNYAQRARYMGFRIGILTSARIYHHRHLPDKKNENIATIIKRDWIFFLNQPCNINNSNYLLIILKRFGRHSALGIFSFLRVNKKDLKYHSTMAGKIFRSLFAIRRSRRISKNKKISPHLF